jgi:hypothetical protein
MLPIWGTFFLVYTGATKTSCCCAGARNMPAERGWRRCVLPSWGKKTHENTPLHNKKLYWFIICFLYYSGASSKGWKRSQLHGNHKKKISTWFKIVWTRTIDPLRSAAPDYNHIISQKRLLEKFQLRKKFPA